MSNVRNRPKLEGWTPKDTPSTQDEPSWSVLYWKAGRAPDSRPVPLTVSATCQNGLPVPGDASGLVNYAILGSAAAGLRHEVAGLNVALSPARGD